MGRMTKTSKENLLVADKIKIEPKARDFMNPALDFYTVRIERNGHTAYLHDSEGIMIYDSVQKARRAVKRIRPDLEPTTI